MLLKLLIWNRIATSMASSTFYKDSTIISSQVLYPPLNYQNFPASSHLEQATSCKWALCLDANVLGQGKYIFALFNSEKCSTFHLKPGKNCNVKKKAQKKIVINHRGPHATFLVSSLVFKVYILSENIRFPLLPETHLAFG